MIGINTNGGMSSLGEFNGSKWFGRQNSLDVKVAGISIVHGDVRTWARFTEISGI